MNGMNDERLDAATRGDIVAFQALFLEFQGALKSYLYRLLTDRDDAEDIAHDAFVRAFDKIATYNRAASLKTWVFSIATHLAYDHLRAARRWKPDAQDRAKALAESNADVYDALELVGHLGGDSAYEIREHIDFCFTCISKTLTIEQQVAVILEDVYDFRVADIAAILETSPGVVKHLLGDARKTMTDIFAARCALISKEGVCHQCSELNGFYNPKQAQQAAVMRLELARASKKFSREALYDLRAKLIQGIDPLRSRGADIQDALMQCTRMAIGEIDSMPGFHRDVSMRAVHRLSSERLNS